MRKLLILSDVEHAIVVEALAEKLGRYTRQVADGASENLRNAEIEARSAIIAGGDVGGEKLEGLLARLGEPNAKILATRGEWKPIKPPTAPATAPA